MVSYTLITPTLLPTASFELTSHKLPPKGQLLCVSPLQAELCSDTRVPIPGQRGSGSAPWHLFPAALFPSQSGYHILVCSTAVLVLSLDWERQADTSLRLCAHSVPRFYQCKSDPHSQGDTQSFSGTLQPGVCWFAVHSSQRGALVLTPCVWTC